MQILIFIVVGIVLTALLYRTQQFSKNKVDAKKQGTAQNTYLENLQKEIKERRAVFYDPSISLKQKFEVIKENYPFDQWRQKAVEYEMEQYTEAVCNEAKGIMDRLLVALLEIEGQANEDEKLLLIEKAVVNYNKFNHDHDDDIIATGEREDLCEVFDQIGISVGLDIEKFDDDIAQQWREW